MAGCKALFALDQKSHGKIGLSDMLLKNQEVHYFNESPHITRNLSQKKFKLLINT